MFVVPFLFPGVQFPVSLFGSCIKEKAFISKVEWSSRELGKDLRHFAFIQRDVKEAESRS